ncbi:MAG: hypothetical protein E5X35_15130 [Mesorhizobium sp.]|uniref:hypothetical protein n=1 Tax=Mesorhizobium sp. TaxID=1871066 RepID=UPI0012031DF9|nr:hypothetical protein [Mesorhizobium sp.]TIR32254.1 MAG: hypothetical protein E5X35_15130 [Mesorhizobium sp.]
MADERRKDLIILGGPWACHSATFRANAAQTAGEIHTTDRGLLRLIDGRWEVLRSGDLNEADVVRNALRLPS